MKKALIVTTIFLLLCSLALGLSVGSVDDAQKVIDDYKVEKKSYDLVINDENNELDGDNNYVYWTVLIKNSKGNVIKEIDGHSIVKNSLNTATQLSEVKLQALTEAKEYQPEVKVQSNDLIGRYNDLK